MSNMHPPPPASVPVPPERLALEEASTADLVREAIDEAKELVRIEIELARGELDHEIQRAKRAVVGFGAAGLLAVIGLALLAAAIPLAFNASAIAALIVGGILIGLALVAAFLGYAMLPKRPLEHTRGRLRNNMNQLKEHVI